MDETAQADLRHVSITRNQNGDDCLGSYGPCAGGALTNNGGSVNLAATVITLNSVSRDFVCVGLGQQLLFCR